VRVRNKTKKIKNETMKRNQEERIKQRNQEQQEG
jgi:hypothetical protein